MFKKIFLLLTFLFIGFVPANALGIFNSDIQVEKDGGIYIFKVPLKTFAKKIKPYVADELTTVSDVYKNNPNFRLVVNGGYFDPKNGAPVSNVIIDSKKEEDIFDNLPLVRSLQKADRLEMVLNRAELRILEDTKNNLSFDIVNHFYIPDNEHTIKHSIQAGPMILPDLRLEEESFVIYNGGKSTQLAGDVLKRRERTILGLKKGAFGYGDLYIIIFTSDNKATLLEARDYCLKLKLDKALNMDGGASTSVNYGDIEIFSDTGAQRRVKSFLVIEK